jgi:hypothetical protein
MIGATRRIHHERETAGMEEVTYHAWMSQPRSNTISRPDRHYISPIQGVAAVIKHAQNGNELEEVKEKEKEGRVKNKLTDF